MKTALEASKARSAESFAVRSASLRNLAVNMKADPDILHDAADMLYDASIERDALKQALTQAHDLTQHYMDREAKAYGENLKLREALQRLRPCLEGRGFSPTESDIACVVEALAL